MKSKKVLLIASEFPPNVGGIGNHAFNLARALANEEFQVTVLADVIEVNGEEQSAFAANLPFKVHFVLRKKNVAATYLQRMLKAVSLSRKTEIIICSGKFSLWLGMLLRTFNRSKKLIAIVHGTELDLKSKFFRRLTHSSLRYFNTIISVSKYTEAHLPKILPAGIKKKIIPNAIHLDEFAVAKKVVLLGEPSLVTIGNVTYRKGQENVINALPLIKQAFPKVTYHILGKPTIKEELLKLSRSLSLNGSVNFHGVQERETLLQKLSSAKIKLMLSNHTLEGDFEGFGIAILEANAFGVPAIGSKNSGIADAIDDRVTGILVDPGNTTEIAEAVKSILSNYQYYSANAKRWAEQHDWKTVVQEYKEAILN